MEEFTISFRYNNKDQKVGVLKSLNDKEVEYNVRPIAPEVVKKFGKQIKIFREGVNYKVLHHFSPDDKEFYTTLIRAIHLNEHGQLDESIKITIKKKDDAI